MQLTPPGPMGVATAINFQPTGGGKAAITGDFVLTGAEVNPVIKALRENGIEVTAIHSHMLTEQPRLIFMHFWANDDAIKLAKGLRAALDKTASARAERPAAKADVNAGVALTGRCRAAHRTSRTAGDPETNSSTGHGRTELAMRSRAAPR